MLLIKEKASYKKDLHPLQWRHLLEKAGTRHIFVRHDQVGSSQHFGHGVLRSVKNDKTLIIQPDTRHQKEESVSLKHTHLWWSKTINNPGGGIPEQELKDILDEGEQMVLEQQSANHGELKPTDIVIMDIGDRKFYAGQPTHKTYVFADKVTQAQRYDKDFHAKRTATRFLHNETVCSMVSETGLLPMTIQQAWAVLRAAKDLQQSVGEIPRLRRLSEVGNTPNLQAIPELYVAYDQSATVPQVKSVQPRREIPQHTPPIDGTGKKENRITSFLEQPADAGHNGFAINPNTYNAATLPVAIAEADKEIANAWQEIQELQAMLNEAMTKYHASQQRRQMLSLQIQPQIMTQAVKAEAIALMQQGQEQLIKMLLELASGKLPPAFDNDNAPAALEDQGQDGGIASSGNMSAIRNE